MSDAMDEVFGRRKHRPDHPDFWRLSEVVLGMDAGFDESAPEEEKERMWAERVNAVGDRASILYMASQRVMRVLGPPPTETHARHQATYVAMWVDAFVAGAMFERARREPDEVDESVEGAMPVEDREPDADGPARVPSVLMVGDPIDGFRAFSVEGPDDPAIERRFANETWWIIRAPRLTTDETGEQ